ncbi:sigma 54-interacting transcriptional regulator [Desulfococcaceae bacterium HSG9]|nr:sigma 54-interacting transcriptional regulator [Desulfococcaceae bacterium HSG9]
MKKRLSSKLREFFRLVNRAALANPFSDERVDIDLKITGLPPHVTTEERIRRITIKVRLHIERLETEWGAPLRLNHFTGQDRKIIRSAFLFDFFHHFLADFDELIRSQIKAGDVPVKLSFVHDALVLLDRRGFTHTSSLYFLALCYQLRRAHYFIDQGLIGRSACMKKLRRSLWNNVFTHNLEIYDQHLWNRMEDFSTMLLGETGTGKGASANAIGRSGFIPFDEKKKCFVESFSRSFVSLNLSQFSETLIESELFGHKKGAFTGAAENRPGVFDLCSPHGAIFLDEIGEVRPSVQIKLLRVLEERVFYPVGSYTAHRFDGRIIAATNRPFNELHPRGLLRDDFFYRLCSDMIIVPPLRQRIREDAGELDDLLNFTVTRILGKPSPSLMQMTKSVIMKQLGKHYEWPGNVRELGQCVRRILLNRNYIQPGLQKTKQPDNSALAREIEAGRISAQRLLQSYCHILYERYGAYSEVARRTELDRRTVKKYILEWDKNV